MRSDRDERGEMSLTRSLPPIFVLQSAPLDSFEIELRL